MESHPAWYLNMQANPRVTVQLGQEQFEAMAEDVPDEEREALWESVVKINKHQGEYLEAVQREIPLVWFRRLHDS
jgi:deazaflavin-dependent oxidoreductase (nitroreductase family)